MPWMTVLTLDWNNKCQHAEIAQITKRPHFHKDMRSAFSGSVLQSLLNTLSDIVHIFGAFKPFDDIAFAVNDKLGEIPFDI